MTAYPKVGSYVRVVAEVRPRRYAGRVGTVDSVNRIAGEVGVKLGRGVVWFTAAELVAVDALVALAEDEER